MKKTSCCLLFLSLLTIVPNTISTAEEVNAKTVVANYLNNGGKMILRAGAAQAELNLLKHFQGLAKLYQGEIKTQDLKKYFNIPYSTWLTMPSLNYTRFVEAIFNYKYRMFNNAMHFDTFNLPQNLSNMLKKYVCFDGLGTLYAVKADKELQKNYPIGYVPILLLKSFFLFNCYQADLIQFDVTQHAILFTIALFQYAYFELLPSCVLYDFFDKNHLMSVLHTANLVFIFYSRKRRISFVSFVPDIINLIYLRIRLHQHKKRYDACNKKINTMKIQGVKLSKIVDDLQGTIQLLQSHQDTVLACYQGKPFNKIPGVNNATTEIENVGSIIAKYIDPSIRLDYVKPTLLTDPDESNYNRFQNRCCQAMTITAATSAFLIPLLGICAKYYFSS